MYLWVKALHIIAMVAWMATLLIYPRYKLHQATSSPGEPLFETMKTSAAQLRVTIMIPAMAITWILGIALLTLNSAVLQMNFIWAKLPLVVGITAIHVYFTKTGRRLDESGELASEKLFGMLNELPFVALIFIVVLVVVKPF